MQAFCGSVRLVKRWVQQQLLSHHLCEEAVELLCAAAFTAPSVNLSPGKPQSLAAQHGTPNSGDVQPRTLWPLMVNSYCNLCTVLAAVAVMCDS